MQPFCECLINELTREVKQREGKEEEEEHDFIWREAMKIIANCYTYEKGQTYLLEYKQRMVACKVEKDKKLMQICCSCLEMALSLFSKQTKFSEYLRTEVMKGVKERERVDEHDFVWGEAMRIQANCPSSKKGLDYLKHYREQMDACKKGEEEKKQLMQICFSALENAMFQVLLLYTKPCFKQQKMKHCLG
jgi:hypothetical protein